MIALVAERVRALGFRSALDVPPFRRALASLARRRDHETMRALITDAQPSWVARCVWPLVDPELPEAERLVETEERLMDVEALATRGMRALRISATIGSALGFIGAAVQIWWIFNGTHGLAALEAGRVETEGIGGAVMSIALGLAASSLALGSWTVLKKVARERIVECRRVVTSLEEVLAKSEAPEPVETNDEPSPGT